MSQVRVWFFAAIGGALTGLISYAFLESLDWATRTRIAHGWLVWLLPLAGLVVGAVYHYWGGRAKGGTPGVIEQTHTFTHGVPSRMAPLIFGGSVVGHVFGASVGREGSALQMAGSVSDTAARLGGLRPDERRTIITSAMAGGWGAVFGVPITGVVFALQVCKKHRMRSFVPAVVAAFSGERVVALLGYQLGDRPRLPQSDWTIGLPFKLAITGVGVGLLARCFVGLVKLTRRKMARFERWPPGRTVIGGVATLVLMVLFGRDYLGLSGELYSQAIAGVDLDWWVPLLKLVFTVVALGTGFVGGEVTPLLVMGATFGTAIAPDMNVSGSLLAATGSAAAFASAASVMLTGVVLTVEQFGWGTFVPALIVGVFARITAGRPGLYAMH